MIFLFTDYGLEGPYIGQVETVLHQHAPNEKVINIMADAPRNNPKASAYLLASLMTQIPVESILLCVVDPRVGSNEDKPVIMKIDNSWFVGPENGLFDIVARQDKGLECWEITWLPEQLSKSFHGRDLYAPVCTMIANKESIPGDKFDWIERHNLPSDLFEVIYIDHFGNCMTGIRGDVVNNKTIFKIDEKEVCRADTFTNVATGQAFWYVNSNGLIEIAVNKASATDSLNLSIGDPLAILT